MQVGVYSVSTSYILRHYQQFLLLRVMLGAQWIDHATSNIRRCGVGSSVKE